VPGEGSLGAVAVAGGHSPSGVFPPARSAFDGGRSNFEQLNFLVVISTGPGTADPITTKPAMVPHTY